MAATESGLIQGHSLDHTDDQNDEAIGSNLATRTSTDQHRSEARSPTDLGVRTSRQHSQLNITGRKDEEKPSKRRKWRLFRGLQKGWRAELMSLCVSLMIFIAIAGVLVGYNAQAPPQLKWGITLNALISLLATLAMLLLAVPVASSLGQLKFLRLTKPRKLHELYAIDEASKGAWGSLKLLVSLEGGVLALVGAGISVVMLAIGPFLQQIISYGPITKPVIFGELYHPLPILYTVPSIGNGDGDFIPQNGGTSPQLKGGFYQAVFSTTPSSFAVSAYCPTAQCAWPQYSTIAFCNSCVNRTREVVVTKFQTGSTVDGQQPVYTIPGGPSIDTYTDVGVLMNSTVRYSSAQPNISFNTLAIVSNAATSRSYTAWQCVIQLCSKSLNATYKDGVLSEVETRPPDTDIGWMSFDPTQGLPGAYNNPFQWLQGVLNLTFSTYGDNTGANLGDNCKTSLDVGEAIWSTMSSSELSYTTTGFYLPDLFTNIAAGLTYGLRTSSITSPQGGQVIGTPYATFTVVKVTWDWIALPLVLEVLVLLLQLFVMRQSKRANITQWRDSNLATLFHGFNDRAEMTRVDCQLDMEDQSREINVKLSRDQDGLRMVVI